MNIILKVDGGFTDMVHYTCELTKELDKLAGFVDKDYYAYHHHYILIDRLCMKEKVLAIRVPGGTVGDITLNDDFTIKSLKVDTNYVVKSYDTKVNEKISNFIGKKIEIPKRWLQEV